MRVLVTGATTPLGIATVRRLLAEPAVEHVLEVGVEAAPAAAPRRSYCRVDLTRERDVHDLIFGSARDHEIDTVVHLALHRSASDEGRRVHARNVGATDHLLRACCRGPTIERFVFASSAAVYALRSHGSALLDEDAALEFDPAAPQWIRDRVEADLMVCARMSTASVAIVVLRLAEILAPGMGSQLWDYLRSRVCLRPLGFDPMINLLSLDDAAEALRLAATGRGQGVYNIGGVDTLPLSRLVGRWGRIDVPVPGPLLATLYRLRASATGLEFRYDLNMRRFHFGSLVDGARAERDLGYRPARALAWPAP